MHEVILDGGLNLTSARPATLPGRIRECLNYEVGWLRGMTRIDGWERFDGQLSPSSIIGWVITVPEGAMNLPDLPAPTIGESFTWSLGDESDEAGVMVAGGLVPALSAYQLFMVFRESLPRPGWGVTMTGDGSGANYVLAEATVAVVDFLDHYSDHAEYITELEANAAVLRSNVGAVPGGGTIVGLHYHEDQLYAVRDVTQVVLPVGFETVLVPGMFVYNAADEVGEVLAVDTTLRIANIAAVEASGFTLVATDVLNLALTVRFNTGEGAFPKSDAVLGDTSGWAGEVAYVDLRDGSMESGNGLGTAAFMNGPDTAPTVGETFDNTTDASSSLIVESLMFPHVDAAVVIESASAQSALATMWRSSRTGWQPATTGRTLPFDTGTNDPTAGAPVALSVVRQASFTQLLTSAPLDVDWINSLSNVEGVADGVFIYSDVFVDGGGVPRSSDEVEVSDFGVGLLDSDVVTGVRVKFTTRNPIVATACHLKAHGLAAGSWHSAACPQNAAFQVTYAGTSTDMWGETLTPAVVNSSSYGFKFKAVGGTTAAARASVDSVEIEVHYESTPEEKVYLWDDAAGQDIGYITVLDAVVQSGDWATNDAVGYFRISDWTITEVPSGTELWSMTGGAVGGGVLIAVATGGVSVPALPGSALLEVERSKYQMISYNFFASEDQNAIYGCSGAGQAFWYDGQTLDFISTGVDMDVDKPRHLAPHENRLHLGYLWGEVYASGVTPTSFDSATDVAASYGFGDKITGLMPAAGKALAVFTESTVNVLLGAKQGFAEAALETVDQQVVNHKVGAIEYTVQSIGNRPIFATFRGIETLETMDQYSDFFTAPLSYDVSPWLLERLQTAAAESPTGKSVINSVVVRNKNQYRLFFADGWVLTLTYVGPEKTPQNTTQQYWFNSDRVEYARCYATASGVTTAGQDRAFFSVEPRPATPPDPSSALGAELGYVYELDRGRSFDGGSIEANFLMTHYFSSEERGGPATTKVKHFDAIHLHGVCPGTADLKLSRALNYEELDIPVLPYEPAPFGGSGMAPESEPRPKYTKGRLSGRGFAVSVHVSHTSAVEFPHTIQMLSFLDDADLRQDR